MPTVTSQAIRWSDTRALSRARRIVVVVRSPCYLRAVTKSEFIDRLAERAAVPKREAARVLDATLALVEESLGAGDEVTLSGFGKFHVASRAGRAGVNPRTGERMQIAATRVPRFTAGSALKKAVRGVR
jgi:DNA-binding protein HU-beta